jgi:hypothetical protein
MFREFVPECVSPLVSVAAERALKNLLYHSGLLREALLLANLQRMSCLHRLELKLCYSSNILFPHPGPPASAGGVVPLSRLILAGIGWLPHPCSVLTLNAVTGVLPSRSKCSWSSIVQFRFRWTGSITSRVVSDFWKSAAKR